MPLTDIVRVYRAKGSTGQKGRTLALVIPRKAMNGIAINAGDIYKATIDSHGNIHYRRIARAILEKEMKGEEEPK